MMPRGLITAVLAVQVVQTSEAEFVYLPAMAFTAILATNVLLIIGSMRAAREAVRSGGVNRLFECGLLNILPAIML